VLNLKRWMARSLARRIKALVPQYAIPTQVTIGSDLQIMHEGLGLVVHERTTIGDRVTLYQGVTIGRADAGVVPLEESPFERIVLEDDVVVCAGAVVLGGPGITVVRRGSVIGANAVLTRSTGPYEIWAGIPARKIGMREPHPEVGANLGSLSMIESIEN
jgi:serine O-acetyltransferase